MLSKSSEVSYSFIQSVILPSTVTVYTGRDHNLVIGQSNHDACYTACMWLDRIIMILFQRSSRGMIARAPRFPHFSMLECCGMIIPINTLKTENNAVGGYYTLSVWSNLIYSGLKCWQQVSSANI